MTPVKSLDNFSTNERNRLESLLMDFDGAWNPQMIGEFERRVAGHSSATYRQLALVELVKIDLQRRWAAGEAQLLEAYLERFPQLGNAESVDANLIAVEFEARSLVEPDLSWDSYAPRFPTQFEQAKQILGRWSGFHEAEAQHPRVTSPEKQQASIDTSRIMDLRDTASEAKHGKEINDLPAKFGRYRILRELGAGAMGKVYLAHDERLDRQVALKTPSFSGKDDQHLTARFYREARAAARLQHRNICPIYDVGEIDGRHFISMGFVRGRCMSTFIKPDKLPSQRTSAVLVQRLGAALAEAHHHNVIHRDLKPANIMIDLRKEPIVMDFGLARQADIESRLTQSGVAVGTPAYMSPEQIRGELDDVGPQADIYALGVILYELLTGQLPFRGSIAKVVYGIVHEAPPSPSQLRSEIDLELEAICGKMMAKDRAVRFQSMDEVAIALGDYLKGAKPHQRKAVGLKQPAEVVSPDDDRETENRALNSLFGTDPADDPELTAIEAIPATPVPEIQVARTRTRAKGMRRGNRAALIAAGLLGLMILGAVIIHFSDGSRIVIEEETNARVEVNLDGTLKSLVANMPPNVPTSPESQSVSDAQAADLQATPAQPSTNDSQVRSDAQSIQPQLRQLDQSDRGYDRGVLTITTAGVSSMAVAPDGHHVAGSVLGTPSSVRFWNTSTGELTKDITRPGQQDFAPHQLSYLADGQSLLYVSGFGVRALSIESEQDLSVQQFPAYPRTSAFPDSRFALALYHEKEVHRTKRNEVPQRVRIWSWQTNEVVYDEVLPILQDTPLAYPCISPDERFVTFGWGNYYVRYDLIRENNQIGLGRRTTFEKLIRVRGPLTFSRDAKYAAASVKSTDFMGVFLDIESGGVLHHFDPASARATNEGHEYGCNFAFTSDGQRVVGADHNGRVALWSFPEGELITELGQFHVDENHNPPRVAVTPEDLLITVGNYSDSRITIQSVADLN